MRITVSVPPSIIQYMDEVSIPMQERADLYERFVMYATGLMTGDELDKFESCAADHESAYACLL